MSTFLRAEITWLRYSTGTNATAVASACRVRESSSCTAPSSCPIALRKNQWLVPSLTSALAKFRSRNVRSLLTTADQSFAHSPEHSSVCSSRSLCYDNATKGMRGCTGTINPLSDFQSDRSTFLVRHSNGSVRRPRSTHRYLHHWTRKTLVSPGKIFLWPYEVLSSS